MAGRVRLIHKIWLRGNIFTHHRVVNMVNDWSVFGASSLEEKNLIRKAVMRQVIILWQATVGNAVLGDVFLT